MFQVIIAVFVHVDFLLVDKNEKKTLKNWCKSTDFFDVYELLVASFEFQVGDLASTQSTIVCTFQITAEEDVLYALSGMDTGQ